MPDFRLTAEPFLGGFSRNFDGTSLREVTDLSLISIAQPLAGKTALAKAVKATLGALLPVPGASETGKNAQVLGMGPDQFLALLSGRSTPAAVMKKLGVAAYCTDQSHNWAGLRLSGPLARRALERICPIDIDPGVFPPGSVARTMMEHLGAIILAEGADGYLLLSASSSAGSFLHAVETSLENVE